MGDQTQAYDIFQTPLSSGYPLPLIRKYLPTENGKSLVEPLNGSGSLTPKVSINIYVLELPFN